MSKEDDIVPPGDRYSEESVSPLQGVATILEIKEF
jgi:hypothetical protein